MSRQAIINFIKEEFKSNMGETCSNCNFIKSEAHEFTAQPSRPYYKESFSGQSAPTNSKKERAEKLSLRLQARLKGYLVRKKVKAMRAKAGGKSAVVERARRPVESGVNVVAADRPKADIVESNVTITCADGAAYTGLITI